jgi:hypothetical protein
MPLTCGPQVSGAAWLVPARPRTATATPPDSSAAAMIRFKVQSVFML